MAQTFWLSLIGFPVLVGLVVSAVTTWAVRRDLGPRLAALEDAISALGDARGEWTGQATPGQARPQTTELLVSDPHAPYRRPLK